jgi:hypothetical protein
MTWTLHHSLSEQYAKLAKQAEREQEQARALELYYLAAQEELAALEAIAPSKHFMLGATAANAASLFFKAQAFRQVEQVAYRWLMTDILPEFADQQLRELLQAVAQQTAQKRS